MDMKDLLQRPIGPEKKLGWQLYSKMIKLTNFWVTQKMTILISLNLIQNFSISLILLGVLQKKSEFYLNHLN